MTDQADHLPNGMLERETRELLRDGGELECDPASHEEIVRQILAKENTLAALLWSEITAANEADRALRRPWPAVVLAIAAVGIGAAALSFSAAVGALEFPSGDKRSLALPVGLLLALAGAVIQRDRIRLRRRRDAARAELRGAVLAPLRAMIRTEISALEGPEVRWSGVLETTEAPALVELNIKDTVSSVGYRRLRAFIQGHEASTIGICGPRGAGKTTLMRRLLRDDSLDITGAIVSTPVHYSPEEFTRIVHGELARGGRPSDDEPGTGRRLTDRARDLAAAAGRRAIILAGAALLMVLWLYEKDRPGVKPFQLTLWQFIVVIVVLVGVGHAWSRLQNRARPSPPPQTVAELCRRQWEELRWSVATEASAVTSLKVAGSGTEGTDRLTRTQRTLSRAESVQALRDFIESLVRLGGKPVVVCIDELDKMARPEDAVDAINGIKDLFHIPGAHFVLSVSTDAMHGFAARGVPVRDVFDSAFDTIVPLGPLTFTESHTLITRRARNFSGAVALFCHAWSGGNARDLIRTARSCVEHRALLAEGEEATVGRIAGLVLRADLREVVDATVERLRAEGGAVPASALDGILAFRESLETDGRALHATVDAALQADLLPAGDAAPVSEARRLAAALPPYARLAALCDRLFERPRPPSEWQSAAMLDAVAALADVRCSLGRHPAVIEERLRRAAGACAAAT
ncbi:P-loop NTPase fold protein [Spirillospora albida]|uniref:P-loop NTPase fold protein n=1 Tax=Spirillospora albida TaxID=58123 RepID=UPI0005602C80|nr:P-loop NTPase fold protein [Spirillospora albida]